MKKLFKGLAIVFHSAILFFMFFVMLIFIYSCRYKTDVAVLQSVRNEYFIVSGIKLLLSAMTYFYSKSFCIIHALLCEFCLLTALATFLI